MLTTNQQEINLGSLKLNQPKHFSYIVMNSSNQTIKINALTVGCGSCTKASTGTTELTPGQTAAISVIFTPNGTGVMNKNVSVNYSEGTAPQKPLVLKFRAIVSE